MKNEIEMIGEAETAPQSHDQEKLKESVIDSSQDNTTQSAVPLVLSFEADKVALLPSPEAELDDQSPLTKDEVKEFQKAETIIEKGLGTFIEVGRELMETAVEKCGGWRSNSAAPGGSKRILGAGVKFDNQRVLACEVKRAGGRAASLQLAPPGVEWSFVSGRRLRSV